MNFAFLLCLLCLYSNGFQSVEAAGKENLTTYIDLNYYVEGGRFLLFCLLHNALKDTILNWELVTSTGVEPYDVADEWIGGTTVNGTKYLEIRLSMRRDFSYLTIYCYTSTGLRVPYPLQKVAVSFDIKVEVTDLDLVHGRPNLPTCTITISIFEIKNYTISLRIGFMNTKMSGLTKMDDKTIRYNFVATQASGENTTIDLKKHENYAAQCITMVQQQRSPEKWSKVYSVVRKVIVHYMSFLKAPKDGFRFCAVNGVVKVFTMIVANPQPSLDNIKIRKIHEPKRGFEVVFEAKISPRNVKKHLYKIEATFKPPFSGLYRFFLLDDTVDYEVKSDQMEILMLHLKILQFPRGVIRNEMSALTAELILPVSPNMTLLRIHRLNEKGGIIADQQFDVSGFVEVSRDKYRFEVMVLFNTSGEYKITYKHQMHHLKSKPFPIFFHGSRRKKSHILMLIIFLTVVIIILFTACIHDKIRSCKTEALTEEDFELLFPRPEEYSASSHQASHRSWDDDDDDDDS